MLPGVAELEPQIKEVLYRCLERIRATKSAFYLFDAPSNAYVLVTQYGFTDHSRKHLTVTDAIIDRLAMRRSAFFINGVVSEPRFSEILYQNGTDRLLVIPLYSRGRLIGLFDMRDKPAKQLFEQADLESGKKIADEMIEVLTAKNLYGLQPISLASESGEGTIETQTSFLRIAQQAQTAVTRDVLRARFMTNILSQNEVSAVAMVLPSMLAIRGVVIAAFSAFGHLGNVQSVVGRSLITEETLSKFQAKISTWSKKRGDPEQEVQAQVLYPFGTGTAPIQASQLVSILSAPVDAAGLPGLVLSIAFEAPPEAEARKQLESFLQQIQHTIEYSISHKTFKLMRQKVAQKLVEPDFQKYPELAGHSKRVSDLSEQFAHHLGFGDAESDKIRIAALVHDAAMRLLDYHKLYRKTAISANEMKMFQEHCTIGAALAEPVLGAEIAHIVLCHHERVDGKGYPNQISGEQIPMASRIIAICDAFDTMTAPDSYQPAMSEQLAMEKIGNAAGAQFDLELVKKFTSMMG